MQISELEDNGTPLETQYFAVDTADGVRRLSIYDFKAAVQAWMNGGE